MSIFINRDIHDGADIKLQAESATTWTLTMGPEPGAPIRQVATGAIDSTTGRMLDLPADLFAGAHNVWSIGGRCTVGAEVIPLHQGRP